MPPAAAPGWHSTGPLHALTLRCIARPRLVVAVWVARSPPGLRALWSRGPRVSGFTFPGTDSRARARPSRPGRRHLEGRLVLIASGPTGAGGGNRGRETCGRSVAPACGDRAAAVGPGRGAVRTPLCESGGAYACPAPGARPNVIVTGDDAVHGRRLGARARTVGRGALPRGPGRAPDPAARLRLRVSLCPSPSPRPPSARLGLAWAFAHLLQLSDYLLNTATMTASESPSTARLSSSTATATSSATAVGIERRCCGR